MEKHTGCSLAGSVKATDDGVLGLCEVGFALLLSSTILDLLVGIGGSLLDTCGSAGRGLLSLLGEGLALTLSRTSVGISLLA